jgi:hypothetical protein
MKEELVKEYFEALDRINREMESRLKKAKEAYELLDKLQRLLPKHWATWYDASGNLYLERDRRDGEDKIPALEFRTVCDHIERITGKEMSRYYDTWSKTPILRATCRLEHWTCVQIRQGNPDCQVTYKDEYVEAHTERRAIVPPECLGLKQEEAQA